MPIYYHEDSIYSSTESMNSSLELNFSYEDMDFFFDKDWIDDEYLSRRGIPPLSIGHDGYKVTLDNDDFDIDEFIEANGLSSLVPIDCSYTKSEISANNAKIEDPEYEITNFDCDVDTQFIHNAINQQASFLADRVTDAIHAAHSDLDESYDSEMEYHQSLASYIDGDRFEFIDLSVVAKAHNIEDIDALLKDESQLEELLQECQKAHDEAEVLCFLLPGETKEDIASDISTTFNSKHNSTSNKYIPLYPHWTLKEQYSDEKKKADYIEGQLKSGSDINGKNEIGQGLLTTAIFHEEKAVIEMLLSRGIDLNNTSENEESVVGAATWMGDLDLIKKLIHAGANPDEPNRNGETPLILAIRKGHIEIANYLIDQELAEINQKSTIGFTPLSVALDTLSERTLDDELAPFIIKLIQSGASIKEALQSNLEAFEATPFNLRIYASKQHQALQQVFDAIFEHASEDDKPAILYGLLNGHGEVFDADDTHVFDAIVPSTGFDFKPENQINLMYLALSRRDEFPGIFEQLLDNGASANEACPYENPKFNWWNNESSNNKRMLEGNLLELAINSDDIDAINILLRHNAKLDLPTANDDGTVAERLENGTLNEAHIAAIEHHMAMKHTKAKKPEDKHEDSLTL